MGFAAFGIGVGLMGVSMHKAEKAEDRATAARNEQVAEQRAQFAAEQRIADIKNQRERADIARRTRLARSQILNTGANTNTMFSSGVSGGASSAVSQGASNLGMFNAIAANQADIIASKGREADAIADLGQATGEISQMQNLFSLGATIFSAGGGFRSIFDAGKPKGKS